MNINKIKNEFLEYAGTPKRFTLIIKDEKGEIIYQNTSYGGVLCTVEEIQQINYEEFSMVGNQQHFVWGKMPHWQHCFFQLIERIKKMFQI